MWGVLRLRSRCSYYPDDLVAGVKHGAAIRWVQDFAVHETYVGGVNLTDGILGPEVLLGRLEG